MAIILQGPSGNVAEMDPTWKSMRVSMRPVDHGAGGYYRIAQQSGALTATYAAGAIAHAFRNSSATYTVIVWSYKWNIVVTTAFGAAQLVDNALYIGRSYSSDYGGGTAATLSGNNCKKRTSHATIQAITYCSIANTAGLTGAPTITLDSQPIAYRSFWAGAIGAYLADYDYTQFSPSHEMPIVLAQNEGLVLQNVTAYGATGVVKMGVEIAWSEVPNANY